jgi:glutathione S-transferase
LASEALTHTVKEGVRETPIVHHIPVCPFSQRLEILLSLKGLGDRAKIHVVDITTPRPG